METSGAPGGLTPLHLAAIYNQTNTARLLIKRGAKVDANDSSGNTPLHLAAISGSVDVARLLIQNNANVNQPTVEPSDGLNTSLLNRMPMMQGPPLILPGDSPLHLAVILGQTNMIKLLLSAGAAVNATDTLGRTPLDLASQTFMHPGLFGMFPRMGFLDPLGIHQDAHYFIRFMAAGRAHSQAVISLLENAGGKKSKASRPNNGQFFGYPP